VLPRRCDVALDSNFVFDTDIAQKTEEVVARGAQVIVANSFSQRDAVLKIAPDYIDRGVKFLTCAGFEVRENVGSYFGYMEQAWYVAGRIAATRAQKNPPRLGIIASFITPEVVRHINAFALGAQSQNPSTLVEVRFLGFWFDYNENPSFPYQGSFMQQSENLFGEELLTARLIESGCEIIAHQADSQRSNKAVDRWLQKGWLSPTTNTVYTIANDNQFGCYQFNNGVRGAAYRNCLGSVYWNWGPLYQNVLDQIHRGTFMPSNVMYAMSENKALSIVGFESTPNMGLDESALASILKSVARSGPELIFRGPYATTGQRAPVAAGETVRYLPDDPSPNQEWRSMCWFVKGVIEKVDPNDPTSADKDALVPDGSFASTQGPTGTVLIGPPGAATGAGINCKQNY
jgi:basic membrane protein A